MGVHKNSTLFNFMYTFFRIYWKYNDNLIDYFLIDYCLNYAWNKNLSNFKLIKNSTNPHLFDLQNNLNKKYNNELIQKLTYNTRIFKLSYKKSININDVNNVYSHL
ncbi:capsular polysaccharide synthesis protein [Streptomyces scabiei]